MADPFDQNLARLLRASNIFSLDKQEEVDPFARNLGQENVEFPMPPIARHMARNEMSGVGPVEDYDVAGRMNQLYQPSTKGMDEYGQIRQAMPDRAALKPNLHRRIIGSLIGITDDDRANEFINSKFNNAMIDWENRLKPAKELAEFEEGSNRMQYNTANAIVGKELQDRNYDRMNRKDVSAEAIAQEKLADADARIAQGNTRLEQSAERNRIATEVAKGGQIVDNGLGDLAVIKRDGTVVPVNWKVISDAEKNRLRIGLKQTRSGNAGGSGRDRIQSKVVINPESGELEIYTVNLDESTAQPVTIEDKATGEKKPVTPGRVESPVTEENAKAKALTARAIEVGALNPQWRKYIEFDKKGSFIGIKKPSWMPGSPTPEVYEQVRAAIYDNKKTTGTDKKSVLAPKESNVIVQRNKTTGAIRHSKDGGKTWINGEPGK